MTKKILIVDDNKNARTVLNDILTERGYEVIEATDEKEAMKKVHGEKPDIALLDTRLCEDMEGDKVCRQIKKVEGLDIKIIIYTGNIDVVDVKKAMEVGADDYVMKTADFSFLLEAIEKLI
jgi:DNA-binding response OmpR family regulator